MRRLSTATVFALSFVIGLAAACLLYKHAWQIPLIQNLRGARLFFALWIIITPLAGLLAALGRITRWSSAFKSGAICLCVSAPLYGITSSLDKVRSSSQQKAVLCNLRGLAAAADQYFLENNAKVVAYDDLVGPNNYLKAVNPVAGEDYRANFPFHDGGRLSVTLPGGAVVSYDTGPGDPPDSKPLSDQKNAATPRASLPVPPTPYLADPVSPVSNVSIPVPTADVATLSDAALARELGQPVHKTHRGTMCASCHAKKR